MISDPYAALSLIGAPALLTNAASLLLFGTINRFTRAIDRARDLNRELKEAEAAGAAPGDFLLHQLRTARKRVLLVTRALGALYLSVGSFTAGTAAALIGAVAGLAAGTAWFNLVLGVALLAAIVGFAAVIFASATLVYETRLTMGALREETADVLRYEARG